jgi:hypothetical protein
VGNDRTGYFQAVAMKQHSSARPTCIMYPKALGFRAFSLYRWRVDGSLAPALRYKIYDKGFTSVGGLSAATRLLIRAYRRGHRADFGLASICLWRAPSSLP